MLQRLIEKDIFADLTSTEAGDSEVLTLNYADKLSCQLIYDVQAPSAKTFDSPLQAVLVNQGVTYTAVATGTSGNSITIRLVNPGADGSLTIGVVSSAITATLAYATGAVTTTAAQLITALNLNVSVQALLVASGAGGSPLTALAATPLAGGSAGEVNVALSEMSIPSHGFTTGFKVRLTTTGTLPAPLLTATDYFVIVIDTDTIQLAASLVDALAGTPVTLSDSGATNSINTVTGVALAGATVTFYASNDPSVSKTWTSIQTATTITVDGSLMLSQPDVAYRYFKATKALTAGQVDLKGYTLVTGGTQ